MQTMQPFFLVALLQRANINNHMKSSDIHNINKLYNEASDWQDAGEPLPVETTDNKTIVLIDPDDNIIGKYHGQWNRRTFNQIDADERMGVEFDDWGEPYVQGKGWTLYAYDGMGAVVVDAGFDVERATKRAIYAGHNA